MAHISSVEKVESLEEYNKLVEKTAKNNYVYDVNGEPVQFPAWVISIFHLDMSSDSNMFMMVQYNKPEIE